MTVTSNSATHMTQSKLEGVLWSAANALRGPVDPGDFKAYVFPVMFFKWISDNWDYRHGEAIAEWGDNLTDEIEADFHPFAVPDGCHWADVHGTAVNVGVKTEREPATDRASQPGLGGRLRGRELGQQGPAPRDRADRAAGRLPWCDPRPGARRRGPARSRVRVPAAGVRGSLGEEGGRVLHTPPRRAPAREILNPQPGEEIVAPACGSGGMLVETVNAVRAAGGNPDTLRLNGQEVNLTTAAIAKMNLYLHGVEDFGIKRGDTFREPKFDGAALHGSPGRAHLGCGRSWLGRCVPGPGMGGLRSPGYTVRTGRAGGGV